MNEKEQQLIYDWHDELQKVHVLRKAANHNKILLQDALDAFHDGAYHVVEEFMERCLDQLNEALEKTVHVPKEQEG